MRKRSLIYAVAGFSLGMICYAIYLLALNLAWPPHDTVFQLTRDEAEEKKSLIILFHRYQAEVWLGLAGWIFPFGFAIAGFSSRVAGNWRGWNADEISSRFAFLDWSRGRFRKVRFALSYRFTTT